MPKLQKYVTVILFLLFVTSVVFRFGLNQEPDQILNNSKPLSENNHADNVTVSSNSTITSKSNDLWSKEPSYSLPTYSKEFWFMRGVEKTEPDFKYKEYARAVGSLIRENDPFTREYYVNKYVIPYNNTLFMVITDDSPEIIDQFNEKIPVPDGVKIIFRTSPYSYAQLKEWMAIIQSKGKALESKGVDLSSFSVTENGTLRTGIYNYTEEKGRILVAEIESELPKGILTFGNATKHRPE